MRILGGRCSENIRGLRAAIDVNQLTDVINQLITILYIYTKCSTTCKNVFLYISSCRKKQIMICNCPMK